LTTKYVIANLRLTLTNDGKWLLKDKEEETLRVYSDHHKLGYAINTVMEQMIRSSNTDKNVKKLMSVSDKNE